MAAQNTETVPDLGFRPIESFFLENIGGETGFWLLYLTIYIFSFITYKLGFARKLPLLKAFIIYMLLAIGCYVITIFAILLPMAEVLVISAVVLGIYRYRLHTERSKRNVEEG
ncbi:YlaH-like family protein [Salirhabdus salicampi]|uniref:YlaH-like family protein n=1 Tax=Salirhabdus salicampi TaxID=476102 RepID=UPI0020C22419|nr:YlaH-like family protein [Salirhabdus salicampi]MCP8616076.1 YlaH-like family protein [Salirhabdus salicampi]